MSHSSLVVISGSMSGCTDTTDNGLSANTSQLDKAAQEVLSFITSHICLHGTSLKVQTCDLKGNYLTSVSIQTEQILK